MHSAGVFRHEALAIILTLSWILPAALCAQVFHNAPASSAAVTNPLAADSSAAASGKKLYSQNCAQCHGNNLQGMGSGAFSGRLRLERRQARRSVLAHH